MFYLWTDVGTDVGIEWWFNVTFSEPPANLRLFPGDTRCILSVWCHSWDSDFESKDEKYIVGLLGNDKAALSCRNRKYPWLDMVGVWYDNLYKWWHSLTITGREHHWLWPPWHIETNLSQLQCRECWVTRSPVRPERGQCWGSCVKVGGKMLCCVGSVSWWQWYNDIVIKAAIIRHCTMTTILLAGSWCVWCQGGRGEMIDGCP